MKKLLIIIVVFFASCSKEFKESIQQPITEDVLKKRNEHAASYRVPEEEDSSATARRNRDLFYHTCASGYEDQTFGSTGVSASARVKKISLQGANIKSWWIGAYWYKIIERAQALIKGLGMKGKIEVEIVSSPDDLPDEIRDMIKRDISRIEKTLRREKKDGPDPALN